MLRPKKISSRLRQAQRKGDLSVADLRDWFGRSYHTVRMWTINGCEPCLSPAEVYDRLILLERAVNLGAFKSLYEASRNDRPREIRRIFNEQRNSGLPECNSSRSGVKGRGLY
jgi:hypothetical protein